MELDKPTTEELLLNVLESQGAILLTMARIYDTLLMTLNASDPSRADYLEKHHVQGEFISKAMPFIVEEQ